MLTENEIFSQMKERLKSAASDCDLIASQPLSGAFFKHMRESLKLVEGSCRQMAMCREDSRWLTPAMYMERAHQIARAWLHRPSVKSKKLFVGLAAALRAMYRDIEKLQNNPVGRAGAILPASVDPKRRGHVDMPFRGVKTPGGIIIPAGLRSHGLA